MIWKMKEAARRRTKLESNELNQGKLLWFKYDGASSSVVPATAAAAAAAAAKSCQNVDKGKKGGREEGRKEVVMVVALYWAGLV